MSDDHELRSRLERLASSAGDPPEHGLERVAARRHRRQHRRRGAVATAAVLAVLLGLLAVRPFGEEPEDVTAEGVPPDPARAQLPDVLEVRCKPGGIEVPVASVRPRRDGMHMHVVNTTGGPTKVEVRSSRWSSGPLAIPVGYRDVRQPVPPGVLTIGCIVDDRLDQRRVDLVDTAHLYHQAELACDESDQKTLADLPVEPGAGSIVQAARWGLEPRVTKEVQDAEIGAVIGYPGQRLTDPTTDPVVQVGAPGAVVAFVHVRGDDDTTAPPWTTLAWVEICADALAPASPTTTAPADATTAAEPPPAASGA